MNHPISKVGLTAFLWNGGRDWKDITNETITSLGLECSPQGNSLRAWYSDQLQEAKNGIRIVDGWRINRVWLGRRHAIGFINNRFFFEAGETQPSRRPKRELFTDTVEPYSVPASKALVGTLDLGYDAVRGDRLRVARLATVPVRVRARVRVRMWLQMV